MHLLVLGSAGTAPTAHNPGSGYLLSTPSTTILLDAGPGVAMSLMAVMDPTQLDAIFVSHRHPDHSSDLFALFHHYAYEAAPQRPVPVWAPTDVRDVVSGFLRAGTDHSLWRTFAWDEAVGSAQVGDIVLDFGSSAHSVPAACVRATAGGRAVVYSGDTGTSPDLATLSSGVDTLLCEATFQDATDDGFEGHLTARGAGAIAADAGAARLVLTHLRSSLDPALSLEEASASFGGEVLLAEPGLKIEI